MNPVLKNIDVKIETGMKVGIVGRSGSGKSSLFMCLLRLFDDYEGDIIIDGHNIKDVGIHLLRRNIGTVTQVPFLFKGTIRTNIDPYNDKTDEEIYEMLK